MTRAGLVPKVDPSLRDQTTVIGNLTADKTPLAYDNIRVDDQLYKQIIWRDISVFEKMNSTFRYEAEENDESGTFFFILLKHIRDGELVAFDAVNDRFTKPLKINDIATSMSGTSYTIQVPDMVADPDATKGIMRDTTITDEFNINSIVGYRVKEEVIFDKETSRMHFRNAGSCTFERKRNCWYESDASHVLGILS